MFPTEKLATKKKKKVPRAQNSDVILVSNEEEKAIDERLQSAALESKNKNEEEKNASTIRANVATALAQALRTDDQQMLNSILLETPNDVRISSIRRLDAALAVTLLRKCAQIFQMKASRAQEVLPWIKELLKAHAIFFMSQPEISALLAPVQHVLREHLSTLPQLRQLQGRLELLLTRLPPDNMSTVNTIPLAKFSDVGDLPSMQQLQKIMENTTFYADDGENDSDSGSSQSDSDDRPAAALQEIESDSDEEDQRKGKSSSDEDEGDDYMDEDA